MPHPNEGMMRNTRDKKGVSLCRNCPEHLVGPSRRPVERVGSTSRCTMDRRST
jgi:ribosomal protein L37AE/L43A